VRAGAPADRGRALSRKPPRSAFTRAERRIIDAHRTPARVQKWLLSLPYNWEDGAPTFRTLRGVVRSGTANCIEAALAATAIMEQHGRPPLVLDLESWDGLDHVLFLHQGPDGRWGTVAKSRDYGLHGRKPVFRTVRDLVRSYMERYVDGSGRIVGYGVFDLDDLTRTDWRLSEGNVQSVERGLIAAPHTPIAMSDLRYERALRRYLAFKARWPERDPGRVRGFYRGQERWL
jgi:hypothetical protein